MQPEGVEVDVDPVVDVQRVTGLLVQAGAEELGAPSGARQSDVPVLLVPEPGQHTCERRDLTPRHDQVDVAVLAATCVGIVAVLQGGQPADEARDHAGGAGVVDDVPRLLLDQLDASAPSSPPLCVGRLITRWYRGREEN